VVVTFRTGENIMLVMAIEKAWEPESGWDVRKDGDYHNLLKLLSRACLGSDQSVCMQRLFVCFGIVQSKTQSLCGCTFSTD
jgi:hypothetical protein